MDSSKSVSSRESLYSVESTASEEEEDEHGADIEVFLSDSGSDAEKEARPLRSRRGAYPAGQSFLYSPQLERTNSGLLCRDHKRQTRKPLNLLTSGRLRPPGHYCRYPVALGDAYCTRLMDTGGSLSRKAVSQKSSGQKRLSDTVEGSQSPEYTTQPSLHGIKRQRNQEVEAKDDPCSLGWTEGDQLFAQKCRELQGFIRPLMELLNRLKMGRFDRGLSSFQQSVAMDRIQRIVGVLQKPEMGERYLGTLLQVERMLKVWFPHVALKNLCAGLSPAAENENELSLVEEQNVAGQRGAASSRDATQSPPTEELHQTHLTDPACSDGKAGTPWGEPPRFLGDWPTMNLTWIHTAPISNPPLGQLELSQVNSAFGQALLGPNGSACGLVLFLHSNAGSPMPFGRSTSATPVSSSPTSCHSERPLADAGDPPRCQSVPGPTMAGHSLPKGLLDCHSRSLSRLPTSEDESEGWKMADNRRPAPYCSS